MVFYFSREEVEEERRKKSVGGGVESPPTPPLTSPSNKAQRHLSLSLPLFFSFSFVPLVRRVSSTGPTLSSRATAAETAHIKRGAEQKRKSFPLPTSPSNDERFPSFFSPFSLRRLVFL